MLSSVVREFHEWIDNWLVKGDEGGHGAIDEEKVRRTVMLEERIPSGDKLLEDDFDVLIEDSVRLWNYVVELGNKRQKMDDTEESKRHLQGSGFFCPKKKTIKGSCEIFSFSYEQ